MPAQVGYQCTFHPRCCSDNWEYSEHPAHSCADKVSVLLPALGSFTGAKAGGAGPVSIYSVGRATWPRLPDDFLDFTQLFPPGNLINNNKRWFPFCQK